MDAALELVGHLALPRGYEKWQEVKKLRELSFLQAVTCCHGRDSQGPLVRAIAGQGCPPQVPPLMPLPSPCISVGPCDQLANGTQCKLCASLLAKRVRCPGVFP